MHETLLRSLLNKLFADSKVLFKSLGNAWVSREFGMKGSQPKGKVRDSRSLEGDGGLFLGFPLLGDRPGDAALRGCWVDRDRAFAEVTEVSMDTPVPVERLVDVLVDFALLHAARASSQPGFDPVATATEVLSRSLSFEKEWAAPELGRAASILLARLRQAPVISK